jgi:hypothetical protein
MAGLLLSACSSGDTTDAALQPAATAMPSLTATVMTTEEAGKRYLQLVEPVNKAVDRVEKNLQEGTTVSQIRA